jgi:hypothetical protein
LQYLWAVWVRFLFPAQDAAEFLNRMKAMEAKIKSLETEVQELKV